MSATRTQRRRAGAAIAVGLGVAAFGVWWLMSGDRDAAAEEDIEDVRFPDIEAHAGGGSAGVGGDETSGPGDDEDDPFAEERREPPETVSALDLYRQESVYPPSSRPLTYESHSDLIEWNRRSEQARPAETDYGVQFLYTADRYYAIGDVPIESYLQVQRDGEPIQVDIQQASATVFIDSATGPDQESQGIPLDYEWNGTRYVNVFHPASIEWVERTVRLRMEVVFDHGGEMPQGAFIDFLYTPERSEPARFTGRFREAIEDGSLVIYAGVEVMRPGWYNFDANLWDANDDPVVWTRYKGDLRAGPSEIRLEFFGKVIAESEATPPFSLEQLRGIRYDDEAVPMEDAMEPYEGAYTTDAYQLDAFSDSPYQDPRSELIEATLAQEEMEGGGPAAPVESVRNSADSVGMRAQRIEAPAP